MLTFAPPCFFGEKRPLLIPEPSFNLFRCLGYVIYECDGLYVSMLQDIPAVDMLLCFLSSIVVLLFPYSFQFLIYTVPSIHFCSKLAAQPAAIFY